VFRHRSRKALSCPLSLSDSCTQDTHSRRSNNTATCPLSHQKRNNPTRRNLLSGRSWSSKSFVHLSHEECGLSCDALALIGFWRLVPLSVSLSCHMSSLSKPFSAFLSPTVHRQRPNLCTRHDVRTTYVCLCTSEYYLSSVSTTGTRTSHLNQFSALSFGCLCGICNY